MIAVDTNILVYGHRAEFPEHESARRLLFRLADHAELWAIPVFCLGEFLRVVTHPAILQPPTALDDALAALDALVATPSLRVLMPGDRYAPLLADVVRSSRVSGNLVFDAQIVALCLEHGVRIIRSNDRDFLRFRGIEIQPLD